MSKCTCGSGHSDPTQCAANMASTKAMLQRATDSHWDAVSRIHAALRAAHEAGKHAGQWDDKGWPCPICGPSPR